MRVSWGGFLSMAGSPKETFTCSSKITEREQVSASSQQGTLSTLTENVPFLVPQASFNKNVFGFF